MELITFIAGLVMFFGMLAAASFALTSPAWLIGKLSKRAQNPGVNALIDSPTRGWLTWAAGSMTAFVSFVLMGSDLVLVGLALLLVGSALAQFSAYCIGASDSSRTRAHRDEHLYAPLPAGLGPQHHAAPTPHQNPHVYAPPQHAAPELTPPPPTTGRRPDEDTQPLPIVEQGTDEYPLARPQED